MGSSNLRRVSSMISLQIVLWIMVGVMISVILPVLRKSYPQVTAEVAKAYWWRLWETGRPYPVLGVGSLLTALLLLAGLANTGTQITTWHQPLLLAYFAAATLRTLTPDCGGILPTRA